MELGGINHVYMPQTSDLAYFGYGQSALPLSPLSVC